MSGHLNTTLPIPSAPMLDPATGGPTQAWVRFFLALLARTGGAIGVPGFPGGTSGEVQINQNGTFGGLTNAQLTTLINVFTTALSGAVPPSGGGVVNFLRADGAFAIPPGVGGSPGGISGQVQYNNSGAFGGLTNAQLTTLINVFNSALSGAVPASGGGTTNFLRADGAFAAPGAGAGETIIANGVSLTSSPVVLPFDVGRNVPAAAAFTLVNAHSATIVDHANGPLVWSCPAAGLGTPSLSNAQWPVPVGSWTYTLHAKFFGIVGALPVIGLSDGTKYDTIEFQGLIAGSDGYVFATRPWTNSTTTPSGTFFDLGWAPEWFRITWNPGTTTRTLQISPDGFTWFVVSTTASPFLTPTTFVIGANIVVNNTTVPVTISIDYLVQT